MKHFIKNINIVLYLIAGLLYTYFEAVDYNEIVIKIATPVIICLLSIFYLLGVKKKVNYLYILVLISQLMGSIYITQKGETNFLIGFSFFFIVNIILILIVTNKLVIINTNDVYKKYAPFTLLFLVIVYYVFAQIGIFKILFLIFGFLAAIFTSIAYHYYSKTIKKSALWMSLGAFAYILCDVFSGLYFLVSQNLVYDILDSVFYLTAIYSINHAMILDVKERKSTFKN